MRNRELLTPLTLLELFFQLFRCPDKSLRELLYNHIVSDIRRLNAKVKNNAVNKSLQNFMYTMLADEHAIAAKKSLDVMIELYKKRVWNDERTVNVIATACFSPVAKIMVTAIKFFLSADEEPEEDSEDEQDSEKASYHKLLYRTEHLKKTKKRKRLLDRTLKKESSKSKKDKRPETFNFSALHMLRDPQGTTDKLFEFLRKTSERFEVRLMIMNLISRLIGVHQVRIDFFSFIAMCLFLNFGFILCLTIVEC